MKEISVIMIDGQFREQTYGAEYFCKQDFPEDKYEIIWVEFYSKVPEKVHEIGKVKTIILNNPPDTTYNSSICFNKGISEASGELIVIADADQIVKPDFLSKLHDIHTRYDKLVAYSYRYDEEKAGDLKSLEFEELEKKCVLKNPINYGGCLSVRKKWLLEINGYEQHRIFESGFHANGLDVYTRFKNYGMAIMWVPELKLYHPWHINTLIAAEQYDLQREMIQWRSLNMEFLPIYGIENSGNTKNFDEKVFMNEFLRKKKLQVKKTLSKRIYNKLWKIISFSS